MAGPLLRLGLFGVGLIGRRHLRLAQESADCEIVAAGDPSGGVSEGVEAAGARFYHEAEALLDGEALDGVIVAAPNHAHAALAMLCMERSLPVLIEKPLADSLPAGRAIVEMAERTGVPVCVGHHRRFDPAIEKAQAMLAQGAVGDLIGVEVVWALRKQEAYYDTPWRVTREGGGGPALINLIHDMDLMRALAGDVERIYAEIGHRARGLEVEDSLAATVRFENGVLGTVLSSDATPSPWGWEQGSGENPDVPPTARNCYRLLGTHGALGLPRLELHRHRPGEPAEWRHPIETETVVTGPREALRAQLRHFCAVIRGEQMPRVSARAGFDSLAATLAVLESGERGEPVKPERAEIA